MLTPEQLGRLAYDSAIAAAKVIDPKPAPVNDIPWESVNQDMRAVLTAMAEAVANAVRRECSAAVGSLAETHFDNEPEFSAILFAEAVLFRMITTPPQDGVA